MLGSVLVFLLPIVMSTDRDALAQPEMEARLAQQELEVAKSKSFYLVVDTQQQTVFLKLRGVELRSFPLLAVELGTRKLGSNVETDWADSVCDFNRTIPLDRQELKPTAIMAGPDGMVLASEEGEPLPEYFDVDCMSDLSIRIVPQARRGLWAWFRDRIATPGGSPRSIRLRIQMNEENYRDLYRVVPQEGKILFAIPR